MRKARARPPKGGRGRIVAIAIGLTAALAIAAVLWPSGPSLAPPAPAFAPAPASSSYKTWLPFADAKPILERFAAELPPALRGVAPSGSERAWTEWMSRKDAEIRGRIAVMPYAEIERAVLPLLAAVGEQATSAQAPKVAAAAVASATAGSTSAAKARAAPSCWSSRKSVRASSWRAETSP